MKEKLFIALKLHSHVRHVETGGVFTKPRTIFHESNIKYNRKKLCEYQPGGPLLLNFLVFVIS